MNIIVYGLGIIGASLAAALKDAGHTVLGKNRSRGPVEYALSHQMMDAEASSYEGADVVFLALPPDATIRELQEGKFPDGCIVSDICGVKQAVEEAVFSAPRNYRYVGMHPMAGKETSGITSAARDLYRGKNLVITRSDRTDPDALELIRGLAKDAMFGRIVECSAKEHDEKIALTSQLAHIVSNAYGKSPQALDVVGFTGGSFQDMTRVAPVDEAMWAELFCMNSEALCEEIVRLSRRLDAFADAIRDRDEARVCALMREGKACYEEFFRRN